MAHQHSRPRPFARISLSPVWFRSLVVVLLALAPAGLPAQSRPSPFQTVDLGLTVLADINHGALHRYWSPGPGFAATAALPFYLGSVEAGVQYAHPQALRDDVPGFRSLFIYTGWGGGRELGSGFRAGGGLRVGLLAMRFDGDSLPDFRRRESELGVAVRAALRWSASGPWFTEAAVSYQSVLTDHHMEQVFLSAGLGRRFDTPRWLRDFLD
jgi:hypothetical protein